MNNINLSLDKLKNAIQLENTITNWDYIKCYFEVISYPGFNGGAIYLYKNDNTELLRFVLKNHIEIWSPIAEYMHIQKKNKYNLIIYPSGEYDSEFIWDEVAHLSYLEGGVYTLLSFVIEEFTLKISQQFPNVDILWNETILTIPFVKGKIQPLQTKIKTKDKIIEHSILIKDITYEETPELVAQFEEMYQLTNEGELKGSLSEKWNTLVICWDLIERFDLEKHVSFEWREENA